MPRSIEERKAAAAARKQSVNTSLKNKNIIACLKGRNCSDRAHLKKIRAAFDDKLIEEIVKDPFTRVQNGNNLLSVYRDIASAMKDVHITALKNALGFQSDLGFLDPYLYQDISLEEMEKQLREQSAREDERIERTKKSKIISEAEIIPNVVKEVIPLLPLFYEALKQDRERLLNGEAREDARRVMKAAAIPGPATEAEKEEFAKSLQGLGLPLRNLRPEQKEAYRSLSARAAEKLRETELRISFAGDLRGAFRWAKVLLGKPGLSEEERQSIAEEIRNHDTISLARRYREELLKVPFERYRELDPWTILDNDYDQLSYYALIAHDAQFMVTDLRAAQHGLTKEQIDFLDRQARDASPVGGYFNATVMMAAYPSSELFAYEGLDMNQAALLMSLHVKKFKALAPLYAQYANMRQQTKELGPTLIERFKQLASPEYEPGKKAEKQQDAPQANEEKKQEAPQVTDEVRPANEKKPKAAPQVTDENPQEVQPVNEEKQQAAPQINEEKQPEPQPAERDPAVIPMIKPNQAVLDALHSDPDVPENWKSGIEAALNKDPEEMVQNPLMYNQGPNFAGIQRNTNDACRELIYTHLTALLNAVNAGQIGDGGWDTPGKFDDVMFLQTLTEKQPEEMTTLAENLPKELKPIVPYLYEAIRLDHEEYASNRIRAQRMLEKVEEEPFGPKEIESLNKAGIPILDPVKDAARIAENEKRIKTYRKAYNEHEQRNFFSGRMAARWMGVLQAKPGITQKERDEIARGCAEDDFETLGELYLKELLELPVEKFKDITPQTFIEHYEEMDYYTMLAFEADKMLSDLHDKCPKLLEGGKGELYHSLKNTVQSQLLGPKSRVIVGMYSQSAHIDTDKVTLLQAATLSGKSKTMSNLSTMLCAAIDSEENAKTGFSVERWQELLTALNKLQLEEKRKAAEEAAPVQEEELYSAPDKLGPEQASLLLPSDMAPKNADWKAYADLKQQLRDENRPLNLADFKKLNLALGAIKDKSLRQTVAADRMLLARMEKLNRTEKLPLDMAAARARQSLLAELPAEKQQKVSAEYKAALDKNIRTLDRRKMKDSLDHAYLDAWVSIQGAARMMDYVESGKYLPGVNWFDSGAFTDMEKKIFQTAANRPQSVEEMKRSLQEIASATDHYLKAKQQQRTGEAVTTDGKKREQFARKILEDISKNLEALQKLDREQGRTPQLQDVYTLEVKRLRGSVQPEKMTYNKVFSALGGFERALKKQLTAENAGTYASYLVYKDIVDNERDAEANRITKEELDRRVDAVKNSPAMRRMIAEGKMVCRDMAEFTKCNAVCRKLDEEEQRLGSINLFALAAEAHTPNPERLAQLRTGNEKLDRFLHADTLCQTVLRDRKAALTQTPAGAGVNNGLNYMEQLYGYVKDGKLKNSVSFVKYQVIIAAIHADAAEYGVSTAAADKTIKALKTPLAELARKEQNQKAVGKFLSGGMISDVRKIVMERRNVKEQDAAKNKENVKEQEVLLMR